ncbi:MAG TPA: hypothetical protein VJ455_08060 [Ignavibacteria bacterium]|nr:hypothetical protein [Ignavibacteria bacterium]
MKYKFDCRHFHKLHPVDSFPQYNFSGDCNYTTGLANNRKRIFNLALYHLTEFNLTHGYHYEDTPELRLCIEASIIEIDENV